MKRFMISASLATLVLAAPLSLPAPSLLGSAPAFAQAVLVLEKISARNEFASVSIPQITIEGSNATKAEIEALLDGKDLPTIATRLAKLSARSISMPLVEITQTLAEANSVTTYKDVVLRNIQNGVIGEAVVPMTSSRAKPKADAKDFPGVEVDMANMSFKGFDMPLIARFIYDKVQPGEQLKVVMAEQTVGKTVYKFGNIGSFTIGGVTARDFKLRPLKQPLMEFVGQAQKMGKEKTPASEKAALAFSVDALTSISIGHMEATAMAGEMLAPGEKTPAKFSMDRMTMAGGADIPGKFSMQGFKTNASGASVNIGEITFDGISLSPMLAGLAKMAESENPKSADVNPAVFIPKIDVVRLAGIDLDVPDSKNVGQRIKAKLGLFETKMANHVGPIPANIGMTLERFQFDIPASTKEKGLQDILALGYKSLDVSARYDQTWDAATNVMKLNELSVRSAGMFAARAKAEIANVTKEIFTLDKAVAAVAALGVNAKSVEVALTNESLFEKLLAQQASQQKRKVEDIRAELAAGATLMVPMFMGDHPAAKIIGAALGKFVADPKNLKVGVTAKGGGLGATDFIAASNPLELLKKVDITAAANE